MLYLPPYSPELAAVELWFKEAKSLIKRMLPSTITDFSKEKEAKEIMKAVNWISRKYIQKSWLSTVIHAKEAIKEAWIIKEELDNDCNDVENIFR